MKINSVFILENVRQKRDLKGTVIDNRIMLKYMLVRKGYEYNNRSKLAEGME
jgi:hypothetical protein